MLTDKQNKALAALIQARTQKEAATAAGIAESTLRRYLKDPEFSKAYKEAAGEMVSDGLIKAEKGLSLAIDTLISVCCSSSANEQTRVYAARSIIESCLKLKEVYDFETRISKLERRSDTQC